MLRYKGNLTVAIALAIVGCETGSARLAPYQGEFHVALAGADRIVVRDGELVDEAEAEIDPILFEITGLSEVKEVLGRMEFDQIEVPCACLGFPRMDWYKGKDRVAITSVQHGERVRIGAPGHSEDLRLTPTSAKWFIRWLVEHGVSEKEIEGGCGGPRSGARRAAQETAAECAPTDG